MRSKKMVGITIVFIFLVVLIVSLNFINADLFSGGINATQGELDKNPLVNNLAKSIEELDKNKEDLTDINLEINNQRNDLSRLLGDYNKIGKDIENKIKDLDNLATKVSSANKDYDKIGIELDKAKNETSYLLQKEENKVNYALILSIFVAANVVALFIIFSYLNNKKPYYINVRNARDIITN